MHDDSIKVGDLVEVDWQDPRYGWRPAELRAVMGRRGTVIRILEWRDAVEIFFTNPLRRQIVSLQDLELILD